jgi:hypothetical protein
VLQLDPYATALDNVFLCSSTPPGGGVHGMCGYWTARSVLRKHFPGTRERAPKLRTLPKRVASSVGLRGDSAAQ